MIGNTVSPETNTVQDVPIDAPAPEPADPQVSSERAAAANVALYRRYRPETFADVIGQAHVTVPLMSALRKNRVSHAYLFSGPRGCGKTTSARILARCLNCIEGPTDIPCGVCDSCVELSRDGSGSLDVIEIDAASHGGVDDARDLRERATFAPVRDRYKIFIIDEAHMVTSAGFNALLKIVEEPPEHIKFIFATTEPEKVIGTIRSRTHHYPFRLVPPEPLIAYLEQLCHQESVPVAPGVLSLVVRAGGGSVRDSLSVLDQLMAGAGPAGLDYDLAVSLLGYTPASLLDDVVDAIAAADAGTVFRAVDRVIQTGQDPRRFVEDLLERFRDLIIINAMPDSAQAILRGMPEDQISRMRNQANHLGAAELSRAADVTNTALTEMTGATSPRLHLELLCARILLPGADLSERGVAARVDRIERRLSYSDAPDDAPAAPARQSVQTTAQPTAQPAPAEAGAERTAAAPTDERPTTAQAEEHRTATSRVPEQSAAAAPDKKAQRENTGEAAAPAAASPERAEQVDTGPSPEKTAGADEVPQQSAEGSGEKVDVIRRAWPEILDQLNKIRKITWILVAPNAQPKNFDGSTLTLVFDTQGRAEQFSRSGYEDNLREAIHKVLGIDCRITGTYDSSAAGEPDPKASSRPAPAASTTDGGWGTPPDREATPIPAPEAVRESVPGSTSAWDPTPTASAAKDAPSAGTAPGNELDREDPGPDDEPPPNWDIEPERDDGWDARDLSTTDPFDVGDSTTSRPAEVGAAAETQTSASPAQAGGLTRFQRLTQAAQSAPARPAEQTGNLHLDDVEDIPSADDETIDESGMFGRTAIERILGGRLIEERSLDGQ